MNEHRVQSTTRQLQCARCPLGLVWQSQEHMSLSIMHTDMVTAQNFHYSFCDVKWKYSVCCWRNLSAQRAGRNERQKETEARVKETRKELEKRIFQMITIYNNSIWLVYVPDVTMLSHVSALSSNFRHLPDEAQKTIVLVRKAKVQSFDGRPTAFPFISKQNKSWNIVIADGRCGYSHTH